jgi:hypothetical protein
MTSGGRSRPQGLILSLGIALLLWLVSELSQPAETSLTFPIQWPGPNTTVSAAQAALPDQLQLVVRATGWQLLMLEVRRAPLRLPDPGAEASLSADDPAALRQWVAERLPSGLELLYVRGLEDLFRTEPLQRKKVPVQLRLQWSFDSEYGPAGRPVLEPDSVWLSGPVSALDTVQVCVTEELVFSGLRESLSGTAALKVPLEGQLRAEPASITYILAVDRLTERVFSIPIQAPLPGRSLLIPDQVEVRFTVPLSQYDAIHANSFHAEIQLNPNDSVAGRWVDVRLSRIPEGVGQVSWHPRWVEHLILPQ